MNTIKETVVLLYYRRPYHGNQELICVCESESVALAVMQELREEWKDAYPELSRFETQLVHYVRRAY